MKLTTLVTVSQHLHDFKYQTCFFKRKAFPQKTFKQQQNAHLTKVDKQAKKRIFIYSQKKANGKVTPNVPEGNSDVFRKKRRGGRSLY